MRILLVSTAVDRDLARSTLRSARMAAPGAQLTVLDLSDDWPPTADGVDMLTTAELPISRAELHAAAIELELPGLRRWLALIATRHLLLTEPAVLLVSPGVEFTADPAALAEQDDGAGPVLIPWTGNPPLDHRIPDVSSLVGAPLVTERMTLWVAGPALEAALRFARDWRTTERAIELAAVGNGHRLADPQRALLSTWTLGDDRDFTDDHGLFLAEGEPVIAIDLTALDPLRPWAWAPNERDHDRVLLSRHPALAARIASVAADRRADGPAEQPPAGRDPRQPFAAMADGTPVHAHLRMICRSGGLPDPYDPKGATDLRRWLLDAVPAGHPAPVARYLAEAYAARPDLRDVFPLVPGSDTADFLRWAEQYGADEDEYDTDLMHAAVAASRAAAVVPPSTEDVDTGTPGPDPSDEPAGDEGAPDEDSPVEGVAVVGYLTGELGVGESARLMLSALDAGQVPHAAIPVAHQLQSRQRAQFSAPVATERFTVTLYCVNADQTAGVVRSLHGRDEGSYRVGMWYWEVEDFPVPPGAFDLLDEIWVATDFIRDAVAPHTDKPVLTMSPPLPQYDPELPSQPTVPGVPDGRPVVLFAFDFLSTAERKNPWGVLAAFERAFPGPSADGPVLVIKSINANRDVPSAERLRLAAASRPDVILLEDYLSAEERDALMSRCDVYLSLHRSEGLGLTLAEAMARGKPVIATGYSGNTQFMTEENSILVPWTPVQIPSGCPPYPAGSTWAEPDIDAAAAALRRVIDDPEWARELGERAARDVRELHSPQQAATAIVARLAQIAEMTQPTVPEPEPEPQPEPVPEPQPEPVPEPQPEPVQPSRARQLARRLIAPLRHD